MKEKANQSIHIANLDLILCYSDSGMSAYTDINMYPTRVWLDFSKFLHVFEDPWRSHPHIQVSIGRLH